MRLTQLKNKAYCKKTDQTLCLLKAISDENRLQILSMLRKGERCVCEVWKSLGLPQNLVSHHLKVLKDTGLIKARKVGLNVHYSINRKKAETAIKLIDNLLSSNQNP